MLVATAPAAALAAHGRAGVPLYFLTELWVPPPARRQGAGAALMLAATSWADSAGVDLWLYTAPYGAGERLGARELAAFYRRYRFRRVAPASPDFEMLRRHRDPRSRH